MLLYAASFLAICLMWVALAAAANIGQSWKQDRLRSEYQTENCQEDDPTCWDCASMGNRICGPTTKGSGHDE